MCYNSNIPSINGSRVENCVLCFFLRQSGVNVLDNLVYRECFTFLLSVQLAHARDRHVMSPRSFVFGNTTDENNYSSPFYYVVFYTSIKSFILGQPMGNVFNSSFSWRKTKLLFKMYLMLWVYVWHGQCRRTIVLFYKTLCFPMFDIMYIRLPFKIFWTKAIIGNQYHPLPLSLYDETVIIEAFIHFCYCFCCIANNLSGNTSS